MNKSDSKLYSHAFSAISVITLLSVLIGGILISIANDLYAFVKPDLQVSFEINEPTSVTDIAKAMKKQEIIENPYVFSLYANIKGKKDELEDFCGSVTLNADMSYREIINEFLQ